METGEYGELTRYAYFPWGTYGVLRVGRHEWWIAEQPWNDNAPFRSCIPEGSYQVVRHQSPRFGQCFAVVGGTVGLNKGDAHRYAILFHPANWPDQLEGCLAPGMSIQPISLGGRDWPKSIGVSRSRDAMKQMLAALPDVWHLDIRGIHASETA